MYSGVTADLTEVLLLYFLNCVFSPIIYTCITLSLNREDITMKEEDNKIVIVDTACCYTSALFLYLNLLYNIRSL